MSLTETMGLEITEAVHVVSEPGNSTRYDVIGCRFRGRLSTAGRLGAVTDGWLITLGMNGRSYLFHDRDHVADWYVEERFGVGPGDSPHIARVIATIIGGSAA